MLIHSLMDLAVVVMVASGVGRGSGKREKVGWVAIGIGKGGGPSEGRPFSHVGQDKHNFLVIIVIDIFVHK